MNFKSCGYRPLRLLGIPGSYCQYVLRQGLSHVSIYGSCRRSRHPFQSPRMDLS
ncbi:hypothetical protein EVA_08498 [gut metagenome]|uniref:Uncharacterized protein n=1 Tax=gut metagenome TaxID=749906 RepID=J9G810_9ZZZZ